MFINTLIYTNSRASTTCSLRVTSLLSNIVQKGLEGHLETIKVPGSLYAIMHLTVLHIKPVAVGSTNHPPSFYQF